MSSAAYRRYVYELCDGCARAVYGGATPEEHYAANVRDLLFMTIAHESDGFNARRQYGLSWQTDVGAWGIGQVEQGSVASSVRMLVAKPMLGAQAARWLAGTKDATVEWLVGMPLPVLMRTLPCSERLAVLFCRLHYLGVAKPVPNGLDAMAAYAKEFYNTSAGKATPSEYYEAYRRSMGGF